jgi:hypothetical protein
MDVVPREIDLCVCSLVWYGVRAPIRALVNLKHIFIYIYIYAHACADDGMPFQDTLLYATALSQFCNVFITVQLGD